MSASDTNQDSPQPEVPAEAREAEAETLAPPERPEAKKRRAGARLLFALSGFVTGALAVGAVAIGLLSTSDSATVPAVAAEKATDKSPKATKPPSITVIQAVRGPITETATITGSLVAREEIRVAAQIDGLAVTEILVEEGDRVKAGQVLARLSREMTDVSLVQNAAQIERASAAIDQARSAIDEAQASLNQAKSAYERALSLVKSGSTTLDNIEQREALAKTAEARLEASRQALKVAQADKAIAEAQRKEWLVRLERTDIKAPSDGIILKRTARVGAVASGVSDALFVIMKGGDVELDALVAETTLALLAPGMKVKVVTAARPEPFSGTIRLIAPEVDTTTRLGSVRVALDYDAALHIGAFGRGVVEVATREGVLIPQSTVLYTPKGSSVQVVKDGVVETRPVTIGLRTQALVEIEKGLVEGEAVVLTAGTFVRNGDRVTPIVAQSAPAPATN